MKRVRTTQEKESEGKRGEHKWLLSAMQNLEFMKTGDQILDIKRILMYHPLKKPSQ